MHLQQPHSAYKHDVPLQHASGSKTAPQAPLAAASASQQVPYRQPLDTSHMQQNDAVQPATSGAGHMQYAAAVVSPARGARYGAGFDDSLQPGVQRDGFSVPFRTGEASQQGVKVVSSLTDAATATQPSIASPRMQARPRSVPPAKRKRKQSFVEGF